MFLKEAYRVCEEDSQMKTGRDWNDAVPAEDIWKLQKLEEVRNGLSPGTSRGSVSLPTLDLELLHLQSSERVNLCFKLPCWR